MDARVVAVGGDRVEEPRHGAQRRVGTSPRLFDLRIEAQEPVEDDRHRRARLEGPSHLRDQPKQHPRAVPPARRAGRRLAEIGLHVDREQYAAALRTLWPGLRRAIPRCHPGRRYASGEPMVKKAPCPRGALLPRWSDQCPAAQTSRPTLQRGYPEGRTVAVTRGPLERNRTRWLFQAHDRACNSVFASTRSRVSKPDRQRIASAP